MEVLFLDDINKKRIASPSIAIIIIGIILLATNLRAPITSVGPLIAVIRDDLLISNTVAGALTTLPLLAFAFISPFAPRIAQRFGMEITIFLSLIVLTIGIGLRSLGGIEVLFVGTMLIGVGIAIGNVLLPGLVKKNFALRIGLMTGVYSVSMNLSSAIASGISVPIASIPGVGWQGALGAFGILSAIAIFFWIPQIRGRQKLEKNNQMSTEAPNQLMRSPLAWKITLFMGLQSLIYYSVIAWFPDILREQGLSTASAGWMISLMQFALLPLTFIVPIIADKMKNQRWLVAAIVVLFITGISGVLIGNVTLIPLWMILIGMASGSSFSLSMMFFSLRTDSAQSSAKLSGMAQSFGYLMAAGGPLLFGFLRDVTNSWTMPLVLLLASSIVILIAGMSAGKTGYVNQPN